ncbi:MAG: hypothetical protein BAJALOKI3v1_880011 [Promethearchaeota archaeon]|nr:MAG: hypothetical protein BAJALOKI3v1_880011 [Candidatus Lokiarchaeota archaeon]
MEGFQEKTIKFLKIEIFKNITRVFNNILVTIYLSFPSAGVA